MHETPEAIELRVEVPGMLRELNVQVRAEAVSITGERKAETKLQKGHDLFKWEYVTAISDSGLSRELSQGPAQQQTILRDVQTAYWLPLWENSLTSFCQRFALVD